ncbi:hypothetical protein AB0C18_30650 [Nonomuraea muscovyensis]
MARQVPTSPGAAYDVVWCPTYRRPVLGGRVKTPLEESPRLSSRLSRLGSWSCFVAMAGVVSAEAVSARTVRRCIDTRDERAPGAGGRA